MYSCFSRCRLPTHSANKHTQPTILQFSLWWGANAQNVSFKSTQLKKPNYFVIFSHRRSTSFFRNLPHSFVFGWLRLRKRLSVFAWEKHLAWTGFVSSQCPDGGCGGSDIQRDYPEGRYLLRISRIPLIILWKTPYLVNREADGHRLPKLSWSRFILWCNKDLCRTIQRSQINEWITDII